MSIAQRADFSYIRYAQCWEDADVLLAGLDIGAGEHCLSIASAGDNALAMLTRHPAKVLAVDLNPAQLYCVQLRVAAYRALAHHELLVLNGSRSVPPGKASRQSLYARCRPLLAADCAAFWDRQLKQVERHGIAGVGKFERYFRLFKRFILPLCHTRREVAALFENETREARTAYFNHVWNNRRWQALARFFFSEAVMGRLGRDPSFFAHIEGRFSEHIARKIEYALCELNPADNPYLHWILTATHGAALPLALREEHFETIRGNLDRLECRLISIEALVDEIRPTSTRFHKFNLSDIFEYMDEAAYHRLLDQITQIAAPGGRLLYWNMLTPRHAPETMTARVRSLETFAETLHSKDQAFFYDRLVIEEIAS